MQTAKRALFLRLSHRLRIVGRNVDAPLDERGGRLPPLLHFKPQFGPSHILVDRMKCRLGSDFVCAPNLQADDQP